jgi:hypothetical protein
MYFSGAFCFFYKNSFLTYLKTKKKTTSNTYLSSKGTSSQEASPAFKELKARSSNLGLQLQRS